VRVGLFGGSFDPIHDGHLKLASAALRQLRLDRVYFIVARRSPFKAGKSGAPGPVRLDLVRRAIRGRRRFSAADWELKRRGASYTVTTLRAYHRRHPRHALFLIAGTDALKGFARWRKPRDIAALATLVAGRRPGGAWPRLSSGLGAGYLRLRGTFPTTSSTAIRRAVVSGHRPKGVPPVVGREILRRGLYRS
jgi:nicotinate-nucleotide adenylyltransferase